MKFVNFLRSRLISNISIFSECLETKQGFNVKFSTNYFHMKTKIIDRFSNPSECTFKMTRDVFRILSYGAFGT